MTEDITIPQGGTKTWTSSAPSAIAPGGGAVMRRALLGASLPRSRRCRSVPRSPRRSRRKPGASSTPADSRMRARNTPGRPRPPTPPPTTRPTSYLQSAWAHFISGNSKTAREGLKVAFAARPTLQVPAEFYSPDFARLAQSVGPRWSARAGAPPPDLTELKRTAREKLNDGKVEEALYDLKRAEAASDPQVHRLLAEAYERLGQARPRRRRRAAGHGPRTRRSSRLGSHRNARSRAAASAAARGATVEHRAAARIAPRRPSRTATCAAPRRWRPRPSSSIPRAPKPIGSPATPPSRSGRTPTRSASTRRPIVLDPATRGRSSASPASPRGRRSGTRPPATTGAPWS